MNRRSGSKHVAMAVIAVLAAFVACFVFYVWLQSQIPRRARVTAIERRYGKQLKRLADYVFDYERAFDIERPDSESIKRLFEHASIIQAMLCSSNSFTAGGMMVKAPQKSRVGTFCRCWRLPSVGSPVVNLWRGDAGEFVEYRAALLDRKGVERSYVIIFDLSKIEE